MAYTNKEHRRDETILLRCTSEQKEMFRALATLNRQQLAPYILAISLEKADEERAYFERKAG